MATTASALHPLVESGALPVAPVFLAAAAVVLMGVSAYPAPRRSLTPEGEGDYLTAPLTPLGMAGRLAVLALLGLGLAAGLLGVDRTTRNIAPALLVGVGWPVLVLGSATIGGLWARLDPWDGLARGLERIHVAAPDQGAFAPDVRWALPAAAAGAWYLAAYRDFVQPSAVATALLAYTVVTLAGCLALGRRRWLASAEAVGLLLGWIGRIPRRALGSWQPPRGAALVLGTVGGGLLFGALRLTDWWSRFGFPHQGQVLDTVGFAVCAAAGAGVLTALCRYGGRFGEAGAPVAAAVPLVAAIALAMSLLGGRLVNAAQLLVVLVSDPLGWGWDLLGTAGWRVRPYPLTPGWHTSVQLVLLLTGGIAGARIARARTAQAATGGLVPALAAPAALLAAAVLAISVL